MSFEGYYQLLCEKGHYNEKDAYDFSQEESCPVCGGDLIWKNLVDETNGSHDDEGDRIDGYVELDVLSEKTCECCGGILEITYKIPNQGGPMKTIISVLAIVLLSFGIADARGFGSGRGGTGWGATNGTASRGGPVATPGGQAPVPTQPGTPMVIGMPTGETANGPTVSGQGVGPVAGPGGSPAP
jgi:hypothetical protein